MAMNADFNTVIAASQKERRDLFVGAATRLGTAVQNVEKDFWVAWVLDALFNGLQPGGPRLLFKGGTSLSKAFGLISRFSEDIDITVFRQDLGQPVEVEELEGLSGKKRRARLDEIRAACQHYIAGPLSEQLQAIAGAVIADGTFKFVRIAAGGIAARPLRLWQLVVGAWVLAWITTGWALWRALRSQQKDVP